MATIFDHNGHHQASSQKLKSAGTYKSSAKSSIYMETHLQPC